MFFWLPSLRFFSIRPLLSVIMHILRIKILYRTSINLPRKFHQFRMVHTFGFISSRFVQKSICIHKNFSAFIPSSCFPTSFLYFPYNIPLKKTRNNSILILHNIYSVKSLTVFSKQYQTILLVFPIKSVPSIGNIMHKIFVPNSIIKVPKKKNTCKKQLTLKIL